MPSVNVVEYLDNRGRSPFAAWFEDLAAPAASKVSVALYRMAAGNRSHIQHVGAGVFERKIDFGPGYRVYFGREGDSVVILLGGSSKKDQQKEIDNARERWSEYRKQKD